MDMDRSRAGALKRLWGVVLSLILTLSLFSCHRTQTPREIPFEAGNIKTIGIIGGVSWVSSLEYYRKMNEMVNEQLGGLHSAQILLYSIEFGEFSKQERLAHLGNWEPLKKTILDAGRRLESGGADFVVVASNTINSMVPDLKKELNIPVLHIADAVGAEIKGKGLKKIALLGTAFTMEQTFYREILEQGYGLEVVVPQEKERHYINEVIFNELCADKFLESSKQEFIRIIRRMVEEEEIQGVILGCTEIPLLVHPEDLDIPVFDSTHIHAKAAVNYALKDLKKES
jgi:aspartate racemase